MIKKMKTSVESKRDQQVKKASKSTEQQKVEQEAKSPEQIKAQKQPKFPKQPKLRKTSNPEKRRKFYLNEADIPTHWYNIAADMPTAPQPLLNPKTREPLSPQELEPLFAKELVKQEFSKERWIEIPEKVRELYKLYRPTPLVRAYELERLLDTPAKIFYKNESVSPVGSHKLNSALAQAYFNAKEGIKKVTTETGAGQWGSAMAIASQHFGLELEVFMVRQSYLQKPYRKSVISTYGAEVHPSPSHLTQYGRTLLAKAEQDPLGEEIKRGTLGVAISEAVEVAMKSDNCRYTLGSVLNHVALHQTVIGLEAKKQMEMAGYTPDMVIACFGGGSNFAGISFPFLGERLAAEGVTGEERVSGAERVTGEERALGDLRFIAAEPAACPKLSEGEFQYDYGDSAGVTLLIPMYSLGHNFQPAQIHAAGLRYHGGGQLVSQLKKDGLIEATSVDQKESLEAGILFARSEGIIPAPESTHAIAVAIREAIKAKESGESKVILFNLSGHGLLDMAFYE